MSVSKLIYENKRPTSSSPPKLNAAFGLARCFFNFAAITLGEASVSSRVGGSAEVEGDVSLVRTLLDLDFFLIMEKGLSAIIHKNVNLAGWSTEIEESLKS